MIKLKDLKYSFKENEIVYLCRKDGIIIAEYFNGIYLALANDNPLKRNIISLDSDEYKKIDNSNILSMESDGLANYGLPDFHSNIFIRLDI